MTDNTELDREIGRLWRDFCKEISFIPTRTMEKDYKHTMRESLINNEVKGMEDMFIIEGIDELT